MFRTLPVLCSQQLLAAVFTSADDDQDALLVMIHTGLETDPVGPEAEVAPGREIALFPARKLLLPDRLQARDRRRREAWGLRPRKRGQGLGEVASKCVQNSNTDVRCVLREHWSRRRVERQTRFCQSFEGLGRSGLLAKRQLRRRLPRVEWNAAPGD